MTAELRQDKALADLKAAARDAADSLAIALLGPPNKALSQPGRELRWGRRGSFKLTLQGRWRGRWRDFESSISGDVLALYQRERGGGFPDAVAWLSGQLGMPLPAAFQEGKPPEADTFGLHAGAAAVRERRRAAAANVHAADEEVRIATARRLWTEAGRIDGTLGERYLTNTRGIPKPPAGWPEALRFHKYKRAILLAATTLSGAVHAVQLIRLGPDARKADDGQPAKKSFGVQAGAMVRLSGRPGPLQLAEGPETGLTAWVASGLETWVTLGGIKKGAPPESRHLIICCDDDLRRPAKNDDGKTQQASAHQARKRAIAAWHREGRRVTEVYPWPVRRQDGSDLNDLAQAEGIESVKRRIQQALHPVDNRQPRVPVARARKQLDDAVHAFFAAAAAWQPDEDAGEPLPFGMSPPRQEMPVHMARVDVGVGKTETALRSAVRLINQLRVAGDERAVAFLTPTHALNEELTQRIKNMSDGAGLETLVWRGRSADDPNNSGQRMCADPSAVHDFQEVALDVQAHACKNDEDLCRLFDGCAYQEQLKEDADIFFGAHQLMFHEMPRTFGNLAALIIDESFWQAGIRSEADFPIDALGREDRVQDQDCDVAVASTAELMRWRLDLLDRLRRHEDGHLRRDAMLGLSAEALEHGYGYEWHRMIRPDVKPGLSTAARRKLLQPAASNRDIAAMAHMWLALKALVAESGPEKSGCLRLVRNDEGARTLMVKGRRPIGAGWQVPTLILDATLDPELVRFFFPTAKLVADIIAETPHQQSIQVVDRAYSKISLKQISEEDAKTR